MQPLTTFLIVLFIFFVSFLSGRLARLFYFFKPTKPRYYIVCITNLISTILNILSLGIPYFSIATLYTKLIHLEVEYNKKIEKEEARMSDLYYAMKQGTTKPTPEDLEKMEYYGLLDNMDRIKYMHYQLK